MSALLQDEVNKSYHIKFQDFFSWS